MSRIRQRSIESAPGAVPGAQDGVGLAHLVGPTLVAALGATGFVNVVSPRYTGEAKLLLESRDPAFARTAQERGDQLAPIDEQAVASQVQVVMSRDLAREAIRRLKLVGNPEFDPGAGSIGPEAEIEPLIREAAWRLLRLPSGPVISMVVLEIWLPAVMLLT